MGEGREEMRKTLPIPVGKLIFAAVSAGRPANTTSNRLFIYCQKQGIPFLVDSGASISVLPNKLVRRQHRSRTSLYAANGSSISSYGNLTAKIQLNARHYTWDFTVADIPKAIIGADFLSYYHLLVDLKKGRLINSENGEIISGRINSISATKPIASITHIPPNAKYKRLLEKYIQISRPNGNPVYKDVGVYHYIETKGPPVYAKARRLAPDKLKLAKNEFTRLQDMGVIRPSKSPWSSPLHIVTKPDGSIRPCGDYRQLNSRTVPDKYSVPNLRDCNTLLEGTTIYSTLDITKAFHHIPIAPEDVPKTAVITPFGLFEYTRMGFGLRNAAQSFQRFMDHLLRGMNFVFIYIDDILIASRDEQEHEVHLQTVLDKLASHGLQLNIDKCVLGQPSVTFLGHTISKDGIQPLTSKVQQIKDYPKPTNVSQLRRYLGMINFYRRGIKNIAKVQRPLNQFLHNSKKNDTSYHRTSTPRKAEAGPRTYAQATKGEREQSTPQGVLHQRILTTKKGGTDRCSSDSDAQRSQPTRPRYNQRPRNQGENLGEPTFKVRPDSPHPTKREKT
ncbi:hypothetical protein GE061_003051 [Apolygus lucorum]|uniref:Reverse transcriptase domain-containing protein n=1 Tax=Apolygus lucorum TaxID=248454 RepID=A0A8S9X0W7_APOLU|nr:hypothetical protein GE061_003051 [Apolygus lucorum]